MPEVPLELEICFDPVIITLQSPSLLAQSPSVPFAVNCSECVFVSESLLYCENLGVSQEIIVSHGHG